MPWVSRPQRRRTSSSTAFARFSGLWLAASAASTFRASPAAGFQPGQPFLQSGKALCDPSQVIPAIDRCSGSGRGPGRVSAGLVCWSAGPGFCSAFTPYSRCKSRPGQRPRTGQSHARQPHPGPEKLAQGRIHGQGGNLILPEVDIAAGQRPEIGRFVHSRTINERSAPRHRPSRRRSKVFNALHNTRGFLLSLATLKSPRRE